MTTLNIFIADEQLKNQYTSFVAKHNEQIKSSCPNAGFDLLCPDAIEINDQAQLKLDTKIVCNMIDSDSKFCSYYLYPRSSVSKLPIRLANSVGIIDSGYRSNAGIKLYNLTDQDYEIKAGDRIAQFVVYRNYDVIVEEGEIQESDRGANGFGSSGR